MAAEQGTRTKAIPQFQRFLDFGEYLPYNEAIRRGALRLETDRSLRVSREMTLLALTPDIKVITGVRRSG